MTAAEAVVAAWALVALAVIVMVAFVRRAGR